jgi:hypothetical protein
VSAANRLVLYQHPFAAFCWKALIALYELELAFESQLVEGEAGRRDLARIWPLASMPVVRDETADLTLPSSSTIVEYVDGLASPGGRLIPEDADAALQARLWDRIVDDYVARPMQAIVGGRSCSRGTRTGFRISPATAGRSCIALRCGESSTSPARTATSSRSHGRRTWMPTIRRRERQSAFSPKNVATGLALKFSIGA